MDDDPSAPKGDGLLKKVTPRRLDVVEAFHMAFQMIGGVPRLALWADQNSTEFYKLYGKLLPSPSSDELNGSQVTTIVHALPPPNYSSRPENDPVEVPDGTE